MGVYKRQDSGQYWISYSSGGRRFREQGGSTKAQAVALLAKRQAEIFEGTHFPEKRRAGLTIAGLRDLWLEHAANKRSIAADRSRFEAVVKYFGPNRQVAVLLPADVTRFRAALEGTTTRRGKPMTVATVNRHLALLRGALKVAESNGYLTRNPMRGVKLAEERNERDRICSPEELERLLAAAALPDTSRRPTKQQVAFAGELRLAILLGYHTAMRRTEIVSLRSSWIDWRARVVNLPPDVTKNAEGRQVPLSQDALRALKEAPVRTDGRFFTMKPDSLTHAFGRLCKKLGIEGLVYHDNRHSAATELRRAGADIFTIQKITGHKSLQVLKRYQTITSEDLVAAVDQVDARRGGRGDR